jgi:hypothetical protein
MPPTCKICRHAKRAAIDADLVDGVPYRDIARRFETSSAAIHRHKEHLPRTLVKAKAAAEVSRADALLAKVRKLESEARRIGRKAEEEGDLRCALVAVKELREIVELLARMLGELDPHDDPTKQGPSSLNIVLTIECPKCAAVIEGNRPQAALPAGVAPERDGQSHAG